MKPKTRITAKKVLYTSFVVNILDVLLNALAVFFTGSVVMLAETFQGVIELISSWFLIIGLNKSQKIADSKHPFGYGKELYFWVLFSLIITAFILSGLSIYFGVARILNPQELDNLYIAFIILVVSAITNGYSLSLSTKRIFTERGKNLIKEFKNNILVETKTTFILDLVGTVAAFTGMLSLIIYKITGNYIFDALGAIVIGLFTIFFTRNLIINVKDLLIGMSVPDETKEKIKSIVLSHTEILEVLDMKATIIGPELLLVNLEIHVRDGMETNEIELLMDRVKNSIVEQIPNVSHIQIELETP